MAVGLNNCPLSPPLHGMAHFDCGIARWFHPVLPSSAIYKAYAMCQGPTQELGQGQARKCVGRETKRVGKKISWAGKKINLAKKQTNLFSQYPKNTWAKIIFQNYKEQATAYPQTLPGPPLHIGTPNTYPNQPKAY